MEKDPKGCLVIHGLSGTPETMRPVTEALQAAGFSVSAPLLPGHGTAYPDLSHVKWEEWWQMVLDAYRNMADRSYRIGVVGLSLGSLLALYLATEARPNLRSVVVMGTPLVLPPLIEYLAYPLVRYTPLRWIYRYSKKDWEKSVADEEGRVYYQNHSYDLLATQAVMELFELKMRVRRRLHEINIPVLAIHGAKDEVAPIENLDILKRSIGSDSFEGMVFGASRHVVTLDNDRGWVAKATVDFLSQFS